MCYVRGQKAFKSQRTWILVVKECLVDMTVGLYSQNLPDVITSARLQWSTCQFKWENLNKIPPIHEELCTVSVSHESYNQFSAGEFLDRFSKFKCEGLSTYVFLGNYKGTQEVVNIAIISIKLEIKNLRSGMVRETWKQL